MSSTNPMRASWNLGRWFGGRRPGSDTVWVIDERDGDRWVEFGRHSSKAEAQAVVTRLISEGRGDASSFRVTTRPMEADEARPIVGFFLLGLVACAVLFFVLVQAWR